MMKVLGNIRTKIQCATLLLGLAAAVFHTKKQSICAILILCGLLNNLILSSAFLINLITRGKLLLSICVLILVLLVLCTLKACWPQLKEMILILPQMK